MNEHDKKVLFSSKSDEWSTPQWLIDKISSYSWHGPFTLDPCATPENTKCEKYYTKEDDGLSKSWENENVFVNPPYTKRQIEKWVKKSFEEASKNDCTRVTLLLPVRTSCKWFHKYCLYAKEIIFIEGRIKFGGAEWGAPFPSMLVRFSYTDNSQFLNNIYSLKEGEDEI